MNTKIPMISARDHSNSANLLADSDNMCLHYVIPMWRQVLQRTSGYSGIVGISHPSAAIQRTSAQVGRHPAYVDDITLFAALNTVSFPERSPGLATLWSYSKITKQLGRKDRVNEQPFFFSHPNGGFNGPSSYPEARGIVMSRSELPKPPYNSTLKVPVFNFYWFLVQSVTLPPRWFIFYTILIFKKGQSLFFFDGDWFVRP